MICHVIVKEKVAEQIILGKYCNCSSFELQWIYSAVVLGRCSQTSVLSLAGSLPINDRQNLSKTDIC